MTTPAPQRPTEAAVSVTRAGLDQWIEDALTQGISPAAYIFDVLSAALSEDQP